MIKIKMCFVCLMSILILILILSLSAIAIASQASTTVKVDETNGSVPGIVEVDLDNTFEDASIISVSGQGIESFAVVAEGKIEFYSAKYGEYKITDTGKKVKE